MPPSEIESRIEKRKERSIRMRVPVVGAGSEGDPRRPDVPDPEAHYHVDWTTFSGGKVTVWLNKGETPASVLARARAEIARQSKFEVVEERGL